MSGQVGQGFDLHRLMAGKPLLIGGITIDHDKGSEAHSDGDVLLHALIDAMLGGAGLGDIGDHFPPSDPQYKNANSMNLLGEVRTLLNQNGFFIANIDATVFLEEPKLGPYKQQIRDKIAGALSLGAKDVSIKAKTAEGFPPVGTGEAIAASVVVMLNQMRA